MSTGEGTFQSVFSVYFAIAFVIWMLSLLRLSILVRTQTLLDKFRGDRQASSKRLKRKNKNKNVPTGAVEENGGVGEVRNNSHLMEWNEILRTDCVAIRRQKKRLMRMLLRTKR